MKYVIDCSAMVKVVLPEADSPKAIRLLDDYRKGIHQLLSPDVLPLEMMNALTTAERKKRITGSLAHWNYLMANCPDLEPHIPLLLRAHAIATAARIGVYDCVYVALAEQESCECVTGDLRLINSLQKNFPFITPLSSLP